MKPVKFAEQNITFIVDDPEIADLPACFDDEAGVVVSCWKPTWRERLNLIFGRPVWLLVMSARPPRHPPVRLDIERSPFEGD